MLVKLQEAAGLPSPTENSENSSECKDEWPISSSFFSSPSNQICRFYYKEMFLTI